jgi:hypothetical protein
MNTFKFLISLTSAVTGAGNPAKVGFVTNNDETLTDRQLAQILAYLANVGDQVGQVQAFAGAQCSTNGAPYVDLPFPDFWYSTLSAGTPSASLPFISAWGGGFGSSEPLTLGISANVRETTLRAGQHNGRHFIPYVGRAALSSSGGASAALTSVVSSAWGHFMGTLDTVPDGGDTVTLNPSVIGIDRSTVPPSQAVTAITGVTCRPLLSMLRTRRQ